MFQAAFLPIIRRLPETCRAVIPIKLEFSASAGFIHKESVMIYGHTIVKCSFSFLELLKVHWFISTVFTDSYGDLNSQILRYFS